MPAKNPPKPRKNDPKKCKHCGRPAAPKRRECHRCRQRAFKRRRPFRYHYNNHRQNAKRRRIPWEISFAEFKAIWTQSGKWEEKLSGADWSMQRKDVNEGYTSGNVEIVPILLNIHVWWNQERWQVDFRWRKMWSKRNGKPIDQCPF